MRIIYNTPKGKRFKKGSIKVQNYKKRVPIFIDVECSDNYWWYPSEQKWINIYEYEGDDNNIFPANRNVKNVKQLVRHMKKHKKHLPKGTYFTLVSRFVGVKNVIGFL